VKRIAIVLAIAAAMAALTGTADAAIDTYTAKITFTGKQAGTAAKPVPTGYTENLGVQGTDGNRPGVQLVIKTRIYGLQEDGKDFPTCSLAEIAAAQNDAGCPRGAEVATGYIDATLGSATNFAVAGQACDPELDVWNSGQGKLTFFFVDTATHQCLGGQLRTGQVAPYAATYREQGKYLALTVPVPDSVNYPLGTSGGVVGSLEGEHLTYFKRTRRLDGRTVAITSSIGCEAGKRPYSATLESTLPPAGPATETRTVSKSASC
jgi:hypothetical protein